MTSGQTTQNQYCPDSGRLATLDVRKEYTGMVRKGVSAFCGLAHGVLEWSTAGLHGVLDWSAGLECWRA
jgi:hypothetical protein